LRGSRPTLPADMRVLLLTNAFAQVTNGPAKFAHYLLEVEQLLPGSEVRIMTEDTDSPEAQAALKAGKAYQVLITVPAWAKPLGQLWRMRPYYRAALVLRKDYPWDLLVYINAYQASYALWLGKVPVLGMINDDNNAAATLQSAFKGWRGLRFYVFRMFEKYAAKKLPFVLTNSQYLTKTLANAYSIPENRLPVLYKSVDAEALPYLPYRVWPKNSQEPWTILFVKADYTRGGLADLAAALRLLPQFKYIVQVVGPGTTFQASIQALFTDMPHVQLQILGPQPQLVVRKLLYEAHIFCVPARQEALGVANMEAALAGTPIVSTTAGGIPEVLDNGLAAFPVEPSNPDALAQALLACQQLPDLRGAKQAHARAFVESRYNKAQMLSRFMEFASKARSEAA